jgi:hypothetical protein
MNAIEAMAAVTGRRRVLTIKSQCGEDSGALVTVQDCGTGLDLANAERIFQPFFTTKPGGMAWGCPSAPRSWKPMAAGCGRPRRILAVQRFISACPAQGVVTRKRSLMRIDCVTESPKPQRQREGALRSPLRAKTGLTHLHTYSEQGAQLQWSTGRPISKSQKRQPISRS